ncbi:MAG: DUF2779 domain-containing protein, partial [Hyphomicrobiaceae bacterium]
TKSRYLRGLTCEKLLWLGWHEPTPYEEQPPGSPAALGTLVGEQAHNLFEGGVLVDEKPWAHRQAVATTEELMADPSVWTIFEAAFEFEDIRVRVDALERLDHGEWGIREVKSGTRVKEENIDDAAVQLYVLRNSGVTVPSVEIVHTDRTYVRGPDGIDWPSFFTRSDVTADVEELQDDVAREVTAQFEILDETSAPDIEPSRHCPDHCDYWDRCTADKPEFWALKLPRMQQERFLELLDMGIEDIRDIPEAFDLTEIQRRARQTVTTGQPYLSPRLADVLQPLDGPVLYLDFEAMNPAIPLYEGMSPYQRVPFQWSLHMADRTDHVTHREFLADPAGGDPRRQFAETLLAAVSERDGPVAVYSSYESSVLGELAEIFPDLRGGLSALVARLFDLLPIIREHVYLPEFYGSFSIKTVGPALAPDFGYDDLDDVRDGAAAAQAYWRLATNTLMKNEDPAALRRALRDYCARDTLAMIAVHKGLERLIDETREPMAAAMVG